MFEVHAPAEIVLDQMQYAHILLDFRRLSRLGGLTVHTQKKKIAPFKASVTLKCNNSHSVLAL